MCNFCFSFFQVYLPCVLQTKKRYVGYMYETLDQKEPVFDAKGIETVRRDSCPAVAKVCVIHGKWSVSLLLLALVLNRAMAVKLFAIFFKKLKRVF